MRGVRAETLEILKWIDDVASGHSVPDTAAEPSVIASRARDVARKLIDAASELEPYYLDANCREPDDRNPLTAGRAVRAI